MLFSWLKRRRRRRLRERPFPAAWEDRVRANVAVWPRLRDAERDEVRALAQVLVDEKAWEGCGGLEITDEVRATVAVQACLLLLGLDHEYYRRVTSILVYPTTYLVPDSELTGEGAAEDGASPILGLAHQGGPVVLAWDAVVAGGRGLDDGHNLVYHEFAHKLDGQDGWVDGTPPLRSRAERESWARVTTVELEALRRATDEGRATLLDAYGATNEAEFFAVATETFFEQPQELRTRHPDLYGVLHGYFGQDPARWFEAPRTATQ